MAMELADNSYDAFYARFDTISKAEGSALMGPDNIVGDIDEHGHPPSRNGDAPNKKGGISPKNGANASCTRGNRV